MNATELLAEVANLGIALWAGKGTLRFRPKVVMPPRLAAALKASKAEVLEELRRAESPIPALQDEIRFWLDCLRDAGCRIEVRDSLPRIAWAAGMATPARLVDWQANLPVITQIAQAQADRLSQRPTKQQRREPRPHLPVVSDAIVAAPRIICPACSSRPVLPELRAMTGGVCYRCWQEGRS